MAEDKAEGEIINIGNPTEYTILEVAYLVKKLTGSGSNIVFMPLPEDDPKVRRPVIDKARELLNWEPSDCSGRRLETYNSTLSDHAAAGASARTRNLIK